ncbi:Phosphotyrosyl phosphatase activator, partial [Dacryopinax primogenitus]
PSPKISSDTLLNTWHTTSSYSNLQIYLSRLSSASTGVSLNSDILDHPSPQTQAIIAFIDQLHLVAERVPPLPTPQRYGNLAFRSFGHQLSLSLPTLLRELLPDAYHPAVPFLVPHLLSSFGNFTRMDYGTGHELSFLLFLLTLSLLRYLPSSNQQDLESSLLIFPRYLSLAWFIQDRYRLEPAGSHGVWGLDDYHFLPYLLGAAELVGSGTTPESQPLPPPNLYTLLIQRLHTLKSGPFASHSPQLYSITSVPTWSKVLKGLRRMYEVEVLGKRVVVQHLALGGVLGW